MSGVTVKFSSNDGSECVASFFKGSDEAVLLLHGLRTDHREFSDFPECLAKAGYSVIAIDFSGCGASSGQPGYLSPATQLEDVRASLAFLSEQAVKSVVVLGHSYGVNAALMAAGAFDQIVGGILVAPQSRSGESLRGLKRILFRYIGGMLRPIAGALKFFNFKARKDYAALYVNPSASDWAQKINWDPGAYNLGTLAHATGVNNLALLDELKKPVLAVIGALDQKTCPKKSLEMLQNTCAKDVRFVSLPDSGHSPFADNDMGFFCEETIKFLKYAFSKQVAVGDR